MEEPLKLGWREWCALPQLGLPAIKAKVDSGAKTSALHTFHIEPFEQNGVAFVRFLVHPIQKNETFQVECTAPIKEQRMVTDSGGHQEMRYIIETQVSIGGRTWPIEMSLTNRDTMRFRMLLGRRAMGGNTVVVPAAAYLNGRVKAKALYGILKKKKPL
ncbi:MAG: RimK/LysX family protein [Kiritimatiellales bacterium]|nr:RimK/LysX family protein [Kiritimatiellales bacterium]